MVLAVASSSQVQTPTTITATSDCSKAKRTTARRGAARFPGWRPAARDHRLAVTGAGGVKNAVGKEIPSSVQTAWPSDWRPNRRRHLVVEFDCLTAAIRRRRPPAAGAAVRTAERCLRHQDMHDSVEHPNGRHGQEEIASPARAITPGFSARLHGQVTVISLANIAPKFELSPLVKVCSPSAWALMVPSFGRRKLTYRWREPPPARPGPCRQTWKSTKNEDQTPPAPAPRVAPVSPAGSVKCRTSKPSFDLEEVVDRSWNFSFAVGPWRLKKPNSFSDSTLVCASAEFLAAVDALGLVLMPCNA